MDVAQALFLVKYVFARRKITGILNLDYKLEHVVESVSFWAEISVIVWSSLVPRLLSA